MSTFDPQQELSGLLAPVVQAIREGLGEDLVSVVLFGSRARGESEAGSDWDLLVVAHNLPEKTLERHFRLKALLPDAWRGQVTILAKTPVEFEARLQALYLDIGLDGVVLFDSEDYITRRLGYVKELLKRVGLQRERSGRDLMWRWQRPPERSWSLEWEGVK